MPTENPYQSPSITELGTTPDLLFAYESRTQAVLAGVWRGAKFGGKWMAMILTALAIIVWVSVFAKALYHWRWQGVDLRSVLESFNVLKLFGFTLVTIAYPAFVTAVISALIMGIGAGISYRRPTEEPRDNDRPPNSTTPNHPDD